MSEKNKEDITPIELMGPVELDTDFIVNNFTEDTKDKEPVKKRQVKKKIIKTKSVLNDDTNQEPLFNNTETLTEIKEDPIILQDSINEPVISEPIICNPEPIEEKKEDENDVKTLQLNQRRQMIDKICQFQTTFPNLIIKTKIPKTFEKCSIELLTQITNEQGAALRNVNGTNMVLNYFLHITNVIENIATNNFDCDMQGYTEKLKRQQDELTDIFAHLCYEYFDTVQYYSSPELRLMILLLSTGMSTYSVNQSRKRIMERFGDDPHKCEELLKLLPQ